MSKIIKKIAVKKCLIKEQKAEEKTSKFCSALGTKDDDLIQELLTQVLCISTHSSDYQAGLKPTLAILKGIAPKDELEGLLATQMVGVHNMAMEFMRRAIHPEQSFEAATANTERATKLLRTFTTQMEALNRYRGKGQQKVTVEHVTVNSGGQAIVGQVESTGNAKTIDTLFQEKTVN